MHRARLRAIILFMERVESHPSPWKDRILKAALLAVVLGTLALFLAQHKHDPVQSYAPPHAAPSSWSLWHV
jgi:hypothetical protein